MTSGSFDVLTSHRVSIKAVLVEAFLSRFSRMVSPLDMCLLTVAEMRGKHKRRVFALGVNEDDESAPYNWWRSIEDKFPPFEDDCCTWKGWRFPVGSKVECYTGEWSPGTVVAHDYRDADWPANETAPYQIQMENGGLIFAPADEDECIRRAPYSADMQSATAVESEEFAQKLFKFAMEKKSKSRKKKHAHAH